MRRRRAIGLVASSVATAASARAAEAASAGGSHAAGLHLLDWVVVMGYAALVLWIGWRASRRNQSTSDYFLGARGFGSFAIGISMFVTLFSTVSYLSGPGEVIRYGPGIFWGMWLSALVVYPVLAYWIIPVLTRRRVLSLYELLQDRLGARIRTLGATMFVLYRMLWMGTLMLFAATALSVVLGWPNDPAAIRVITIVMGLVAIGYTSLGGLRAVVLTDVLQFFVLFGGVVVTIAIVTARFGGFDWLPREAAPHWPEQPWFSWDLTVRVTIIGAAVQWMITDIAHGVDQTQVQRYIAAADLGRARRALLVRVAGSLVVWTFLVLLGLALMSYYQRFAPALPAGETLASFADKLFPLFIAHELPVGLSGLVVAGILAAGMSSVDSGVNSITAVGLNDFVERRGPRFADERARQRFATLLATGVGLGVIVFSLFIAEVRGNFYEVANRTFRLFIPLELGLIVLAMFVRSATPLGVVWGIAYGLTLGFVIAYWERLTGSRGLSVTYYVPAIFLIQMLVSWLASRVPVAGASRVRMIGANVALLAPLVAIVALVAAGAFDALPAAD